MSKSGLVVHLEIAPDKLDEFVDIARRHGRRSMENEEGCLGFEVMIPQDSDNRVILVEIYRDDAALESHWESPHMRKYLEQVKDMILDRKPVRCTV